jgi:hypothetical protein
MLKNHRTLNKIESCIHRTLNKIESCINRTLNHVPNVGNLYKFNMYEPNISVFRTQKRVPKRFHLNRYHCTTRNSFIHVIMSEQSTFQVKQSITIQKYFIPTRVHLKWFIKYINETHCICSLRIYLLCLFVYIHVLFMINLKHSCTMI